MIRSIEANVVFCSGNKTQCDYCSSKAMRRSRLKKEREQTVHGVGEVAGGEATTTAVPPGPGYHLVDHEDGISSLSIRLDTGYFVQNLSEVTP